MAAGRVWECVILYLIAVVSCQVELKFGDRVVRNNSYIRAGDIPGSAEETVNALLCASDTTNPTTRQWYDRDGTALGDTVPLSGDGTYQVITSGGVLLYRVGIQDRAGAGLHYCRISDSSGNIHTLYAGIYTDSTAVEQSGRANGEKLLVMCN